MFKRKMKTEKLKWLYCYVKHKKILLTKVMLYARTDKKNH